MNWRKHFGYNIVLWILGGVSLAIFMAFVFGAVVMLLWNRLMPDIFGLKTITYWQAWGLVLLAHLLFKGGHSGHGHKSRRDWAHDEHWRESIRDRIREGRRNRESGPEDEKTT